ncbi:MAG TPA: hypothetical protein VH744_09735 [Terriglobales bacterium]|jgi:hypothetical protein
MKHDGVTVTALIALAAFAIERVTTGLLFLLSFWRTWQALFSCPGEPGKAEKRSKLAYFVLAGALVLLVVLIVPEIRVLNVLNIQAPEILDVALTWLVLVGGSDRIGELVKGRSAAAPEKPSKPIEIKGSVRLVEDREHAA